MAKNTWVSRRLVSYIAFAFGKIVERYEYPVAYIAATSTYNKEVVYKVARHLNLHLHLRNGEWTEKGKSVKELIKTKQYEQEKEKQD